MSNSEVFERVTNTNIPTIATISRDEYHDMGQDYVKILELKLDQQSFISLKSSIENSVYYDSAAYSDSSFNFKKIKRQGKYKGLWFRYKDGFRFHGWSLDGIDNITVEIDSIKMIGTFNYSSN